MTVISMSEDLVRRTLGEVTKSERRQLGKLVRDHEVRPESCEL